MLLFCKNSEEDMTDLHVYLVFSYAGRKPS